jgi:ATP-dependent Lon protease
MSESQTLTLPVLPLKSSVLFPRLLLPLAIGRQRSVAAVEAAAATQDKMLLCLTQRDPAVNEPTPEQLYTVGTVAVIKKLERAAEGMHIFVQGLDRVEVVAVDQTEPYLKMSVRPLAEPADTGPEVEALHRAVLDQADRISQLVQPDGQVTLRQILSQAPDPIHQAYLLATLVSLDWQKEQALLEAPTRAETLRLLHGFLAHEVQVLELRHKIATQAASEMGREQREYVLRQQMRAIREELGEQDPEQAEIEELRRRLEEAHLPELAHKEADRELRRLQRLPAAAAEYQVIRTYLDLLLELPWNATTTDVLDVQHARSVLDADHFDLDDVKERILEHLAVLKLNPQAKAPILCFVGPPGVGKTSLGESIARAMGRRFERMSLGGLHDEAELRGHRRTYIGAMPGRILHAIRRAGVRNPVLMLDEVDKLGHDYRGDPAAALLEILDPAQNAHFLDNYLDLPFDLSQVFFITTANSLHGIPRPLLDRMEVLRLAGYSDEEKAEIAVRYLLPRQLREAGLTSEQLLLADGTLPRIIHRYTREAGVRELERCLGRLARKAAVQFAQGRTEPVVVRPDDLADMLGPEKFLLEAARAQLPPGVAAGLAWTEAGGEVLYVEAVLLPEGKGLLLTGQLGEVMQESAKTAQSYLWSRAAALGIDRRLIRESGVHVHVPAGAIPKDGPSAGVTMATAMASLYTGLPVEPDTAMTGEISLTGLVLPVGGIKEKLLAARRAGLRRVILPRENQKDLVDVPDNVREALEITWADQIEDVLAAAIPALAERMVGVQRARL